MGLRPRIYKERQHLDNNNKHTQATWLKNGQGTLTDISPKKILQMADRHTERLLHIPDHQGNANQSCKEKAPHRNNVNTSPSHLFPLPPLRQLSNSTHVKRNIYQPDRGMPHTPDFSNHFLSLPQTPGMGTALGPDNDSVLFPGHSVSSGLDT